MVWLESDAAALKVRPLRITETMMLTNREMATSKFFDLRRLQSRYQSFAAFDGGDACLLRTLSPHLAKTSAQKKNIENNSNTGKTSTHTP